MSVNKVTIMGRLGKEPELKYTPSGMAVCSLTVATSEAWKDKSGQKQERTEWHKIVVWGRLAELCNQYLTKGRQVYLEGALQTRSWDDKNGQKRYTTEIVAKTVQFIGANSSKDSNQGKSQEGKPQGKSNNQQEDMMDMGGDDNYDIMVDPDFSSDDIPF